MVSRWTNIDESLMHSNGIVDSALSAQRRASLPWTPCCSSKLRLNRRNLSARRWRSLQGGILSDCRRTTIFTPNQVLTSCFTQLFCYCSWKEWHTICMQCSPKKRSPSIHPSIIPSVQPYNLEPPLNTEWLFMDWGRGTRTRTSLTTGS